MTARFHTCSVTKCGKPSVRIAGGCEGCQRHLCYKHLSRSFHHCKLGPDLDDASWRAQQDAEIDRLRAWINDAAACEYASKLNRGRACSAEHASIMGCANYHVRIRFHDGSPSWLLRVPRATSLGSCPEPIVEYLVVSEYATLKFLETTSVPAPRVFGYGIRGGDDYGVGASFLLVEELPGTPWLGNATEEGRAKIWNGLASILAELSRRPFSKAGSLCLEEGSSAQVGVGPTASDRFGVLSPDGPFHSATAYYTAWAEQYLELIADRQLYPDYPIDAYLVYRFLKDNAWQLAQIDEEYTAAATTTTTGGKRPRPSSFFLKHTDDHGDHLLIDDDYNITGIIDWQLARVVPPSEAFGASLATADMQAFTNGGGLGADDLALASALRAQGHAELARLMGDDDKGRARRFLWGLGQEEQWKYARPCAGAVLDAFGVTQEWAAWRETALREYARDDKRLRALVRSCPPRRLSLPRRCKKVVR